MKNAFFFCVTLCLVLFFGCKKDEDVKNLPTADFIVEQSYALDTLNQEVIIKPVNKSTGASSYHWECGTQTSTAENPEFVVKDPGDINIKLTAINSDGENQKIQKIKIEDLKCWFHIKINASSDLLLWYIVYWGDAQHDGVEAEFSFFLPKDKYGTTISDFSLSTKTSAKPDGQIFFVPPFTVKYQNNFTFNAL